MADVSNHTHDPTHNSYRCPCPRLLRAGDPPPAASRVDRAEGVATFDPAPHIAAELWGGEGIEAAQRRNRRQRRAGLAGYLSTASVGLKSDMTNWLIYLTVGEECC